MGPWLVRPRSNTITRSGAEKHLENRLMRTLVFMAEYQGQVLTRTEFFDTVWQGLVVNEEALSRAISLLRSALEDNARSPRYIQTIPGIGYRLIAEVQVLPKQAPNAPSPVSSSAASLEYAVNVPVEQLDGGVKRRRRAAWYLVPLMAVVITWSFTYLYLGPQPSGAGQEQDAAPVAYKEHGAPIVAIMPMETLTEDPDASYLARVSGEDLLLRLKFASFGTVTVRDTPTNFDARAIGQQYGVDYIWYRSIARNADRFRISKRLVETDGGTDVVSYHHDFTGPDVFAIQAQMASFSHEFTIAVLNGEARRLKALPVDGMNAWDLLHKPTDSPAEARTLAERAYRLFPNDYGANSVLAAHLRGDVVFQRSGDMEGDKARALKLARRGYELAPHDEYAIQIVCATELSFGDPKLALAYARKLEELKSFTGSEFYDVLIGNGLAQEALDHASQNPLVRARTRGDIYLQLDRYADAAGSYRRQLADTPNEFIAWVFLANALALDGNLEEGRDVLAKLDEELAGAGLPGFSIEQWEIGVTLAWGEKAAGKLVAGLKLLRDYLEQSSDGTLEHAGQQHVFSATFAICCCCASANPGSGSTG